MGSLRYYIVRRLALFVVVVFGVTVVAFVVTNLVPADPLAAVIGSNAYQELSPATLAAMRKSLGLDQPLYVQYFRYLVGLVQGKLGLSLHTGQPVIADLLRRAPLTIELAIGAFLISLVIGIPMGIFSAIRRNSIVDTFSSIFSLVGVAIPSFLIGLVILFVFYVRFPIIGPGQLSPGVAVPPHITGMVVVDSLLVGNLSTFVDAIQHLIAPAFVLGFATSAYLNRITRQSMLEVLDQDYIRTSKAYGFKNRVIYYRHALKNALIPTVTLAGISFGDLLSGAVITETIFNWPGIGSYAVDSAFALDFPAIMGVSIFIALAYASVNLVADVLYAVLDPRIRY